MTEDVNPRFETFDQWPTVDAVKAMYDGQLAALVAIKPSLEEIAKAADMAAEKLHLGGRLVYVGAGTSGRLGVLDGSELGPTFNWPSDRLVFCMAGGLEALTVSAEGAEDSQEAGREIMCSENISKHDVVIGIAASGRTPFTLGALIQADENGALTIGIANNPATPILRTVDHPILAHTGSEILAGSTRMKAGTAQKAILNMLSTAIMTRLGRVYKGLMVDMIASNNKLEKRAINMVCDITACSHEDAIFALDQADKKVKLAVLIAKGNSLMESRDLLARSDGKLRQALELITDG